MAKEEHVLYFATIAAGGGDIAFAMHAIAAMLARGLQLHVAISAQAGADPIESAYQLARVLEEFDVDVANLREITAGTRVDTSSWKCLVNWKSLAALKEHMHSGAGSISTPTAGLRAEASLANLFRCVIQGPLRLFESGEAAVQAVHGVVRTIPMLTIREFGQALFCSSSVAGLLALQSLPAASLSEASSPLQMDLMEELRQVAQFAIAHLPSTPSTDLHKNVHIDLSAGCAPGEIGVFKEHFAFQAAGDRKGVVGSTDAEAAIYFAGYYRTSRHSRRFAHLVIGQMTTRHALGLEVSQSSPAKATVWLPMDAISLDAFTAGLAECTGVSDITTLFDAEVSHVIRLALPGGTPCELTLKDIWTRKISMRDFQMWMAGSSGCCVTGDASFNEALAANLPFVYSAEPHKQGVATALLSLLGQEAAAVSTFGRRPETLAMYVPASTDSPLIDRVLSAEESICMLLKHLIKIATDPA
jgi:hypothetical protein